MTGNSRGKKKMPDVVLDREVLLQELQAGRKLCVIAQRLGVSEYYVSANMRYYALSRSCELPPRMQHIELDIVEQLDVLSPGLLESAKNFYNDPQKYCNQLYLAHCKVLELQLFIKQQAATWIRLKDSGHVERNHISFSTNIHEMRVSLALLHAGIPHMRNYPIGRYYTDFWFPDSTLLLEIDGEFHKKDQATQVRDLAKTKYLESQGYQIVRFTTQQVEEDTPTIITSIKNLLSQFSPQEPVQYGT
jgi:very-short-patch-repair endonuclease